MCTGQWMGGEAAGGRGGGPGRKLVRQKRAWGRAGVLRKTGEIARRGKARPCPQLRVPGKEKKGGRDMAKVLLYGKGWSKC